MELFIVTCCDSLNSNFVYHVGTILSPHTEKEYDENMYTLCASLFDIDILLYNRSGGVGGGQELQMGVASSEFWDIPTSVITNYCTNAITIG
jgi:hypothetical protein